MYHKNIAQMLWFRDLFSDGSVGWVWTSVALQLTKTDYSSKKGVALENQWSMM